MSGVTIRFLGSGNAFADGGRSNACVHVAAPGVSLLLDCGGSALPAIKQWLDPKTITACAITHLHGDHFGGLPYLLMEQHFGGRTAPFAIGGPRELRDRLERAGSALFTDFYGPTPLGYPLRYLTLGAKPQELGGAEVSALPVVHVPEADPHGLRVRVAGKVIAYSGDATWSAELVELARGADLFICEATSFSTPHPVHVTYRELMEHRSELDCGEMILTHLGEETIAHLSEVELPYATDGMTLEL